MPGNTFKSIFLCSLFLAGAVGGEASGREGKTSSLGWESLSRQAAQAGDYARALDYLKRLELKKFRDPDLLQQQAHLLYKLGEKYYFGKNYQLAEEYLQEALSLEPNNPSALKALGYIAYYSQDLGAARDYWQKALVLNPQDSQLALQLKNLQNEARIESNLDFSSLANFDIRFHDDNQDYDIYDIQSYLLEAYREIGYDFNYYPTRPIIIILYTREEFERLRTTPRWVGGLYDGKIRLPVKAKQLTATDFKKIIWHEYTHALIHDLSKNRCPSWLHEGLAQHEEAKIEAVNLDPLQRGWVEQRLIPLNILDQALSFASGSERAGLAYAQAYSLTEYLIDRYGFWKINLILERLGKGGDWKTVLEDELLLPLADLEKEWHNHLEYSIDN